jgi:hypothetical protein
VPCSGIRKNVGGSIKREHVAAFDDCQGSPCQPHNPGIETIAGGSAQYAPLRLNRVGATSTPLERFIAQHKLTRQIFDENLPYLSPLGLPSPRQVFGAFVRDAGYTATWVLQVEVRLGIDSAVTHWRTLADCRGVIQP